IRGLVPIWLFVPPLAPITAIITGHMALPQLKRDPSRTGQGLPIWGLVLGYIAVVGPPLLSLFWIALIPPIPMCAYASSPSVAGRRARAPVARPLARPRRRLGSIMKRKSDAPAVTSLPRAPQDEADGRVRQYLITMGIRVACFILMVAVQPYGWYTWV